MRHHLIAGAIDSILVIKRHWLADDGGFGPDSTKLNVSITGPSGVDSDRRAVRPGMLTFAGEP
jgi:hypothetical protein